MRPIHAPKTRRERRYRRRLRVRKKVQGTAERPRLVVFRSLKHVYAQLVDDERGVTLLGVADRSEGVTPEGSGKVAKARSALRIVGMLKRHAGNPGTRDALVRHITLTLGVK